MKKFFTPEILEAMDMELAKEITLENEIKDIIKHFNLDCSVEEFSDKASDKVIWGDISRYKYLSEYFITIFKNNVYWMSISSCQILSEQFIEKFEDEVDWMNISWSQQLSEQFVEKFQHKIHWLSLCMKMQLTEEFIEKVANSVRWDAIVVYQNCSNEFIFKYRNKINFNKIKKEMEKCKWDNEPKKETLFSKIKKYEDYITEQLKITKNTTRLDLMDIE